MTRLRSLLTASLALALSLAAVSTDAVPLARLGVEETGIQEVDAASLAAAGIALPADTATLGVEFRGDPVPSELVLAEDGSLQAIRFWGEDINRHPAIGRYSADNAYVLATMDQPPPRVTAYNPPEDQLGTFPEGFTAIGTFLFNKKFSVNPAAFQQEHENYYFGPYFGPRGSGDRSMRVGFDLTGFDAASPMDSVLTVTAFGWTDLPVAPDHQLVLQINDQDAGEMTWDGKRRGTHTGIAPRGALKPGWNTFVADAPGTLEDARRVSPGMKDETGLTKVALDMGVLEEFTIRYPHRPIAVKDVYEITAWQADTPTSFTAPTTVHYFTDPAVVAWDIANARSFPVLATQSRDTFHSVTFAPLYEDDIHLWAAPRTRLPRPSVRPWHAGAPATLAAAAELVIIVHPEFREAAERLRAHREALGTSTCLLDPEQLYDAYNFGLKDAAALRTFLDAVRAAPGSRTHSLLLLGGASFDTKSLFPEKHAPNFIPALYTPSGNNPPTSADNLLSATSTTRQAPTFPVGRLPARSAAEALVMVDKIIAFETAGAAPWKRRLVFASGEKGIFHSASNDTIAAIEAANPATDFAVTRIFPDEAEEKDYHVYYDRFTDAINNGTALVSYIGHGASLYWRFSMEKGTEKWDIRIMTPENIDALTNAGMPFITYGGTCYTNKFDIESAGSICLRLLAKENGGAVASVSTAYRMTMTDATNFQDAFARSLYDERHETLGEAYVAAFETVNLTADATATMVLLGDPSMDIRGLHNSAGEQRVSLSP
ncbi:MAG: hypothetical protein PWP23_2815 [Candidatus Sumerlaeota bacterium]|nr:hypothetical protein [Candidatus Sumerlaeota bacterium]